MKNLEIPFYAILFIVGSVMASCSTGNKEGSHSDHETMEASEHHDESEEEGQHEMKQRKVMRIAMKANILVMKNQPSLKVIPKRGSLKEMQPN